VGIRTHQCSLCKYPEGRFLSQQFTNSVHTPMITYQVV